MSYVIGLDIGTTSTIGILLSLPDKILGHATRPVKLSSPFPGWAEENPDEWWKNVVEIIPELISKAKIGPEEIHAIGVTGMLPAVVLLDSLGKVLRPSIQQSDGRCGEQVQEIKLEFKEKEFIKKTGNGINQQLVAAKLRWIEKHEPEIFAQISTVFGSYDFINWKLTGEKAVEQNWALEAGFVDTTTGLISNNLVSLGHIPRSAIPRKIASHSVLGKINEDSAKATGLSKSTLVVGGAADHIASAYVAGVNQPGDVLLKFGGATDIMIATDKLKPDPRMFLDLHLIPGLYMPNGCMASGGSALNWFVDKLAKGERENAQSCGITLHQYLDKIATETLPGSEGVQIIPYFLGEKTPIHDPYARGIIRGISLNHDIRHLWRALLEGFGYAFRHHIEVFNEMGHPTTRFLASDGGSNSNLWMQICADILQQPIQLLRGHPGSCLGAAWMAVIGSEMSDDWFGITDFVSYSNLIEPNTQNAELYNKGYRTFRQTYQALVEV